VVGYFSTFVEPTELILQVQFKLVKLSQPYQIIGLDGLLDCLGQFVELPSRFASP
jgi:hypothetical protein